MPYLLHQAAALALLAALLWLPGFALEAGVLRLPPGDALRGVARWCLGLAAWIAALFLLAATGQLHRLGVAAVALVAALAAAVAARRRRADGAAPPPVEGLVGVHGPTPWRCRALAGVGAAAVALLLTPFFLLAASPTVSWDASAYHLTVPRLYLEAHGFREVPFNVYSNWPLATELLFALAMLVDGYVLAKLVHFGCGALTLYALWAACRAGGESPPRPLAGVLAMTLFLANPVVAFEIKVAYVDLTQAFFLLAAFLFMARAVDAEEGDAAGGRYLLLAGVCGGVLAGVKVTGVVSAAAVAALYLPRLLRRAGRGAAWRGFALRFALPVAALWAPWLAKAAWYTGNPVYPLLYGVFGGPYWSPDLGERLASWQQSIGMGREPLDYLLLPLRVILFGGRGYDRFDGALGVFWLALLPLALWAARRARRIRRCLAVVGLCFAAWAATSQQMRFLIPVLPLLALAGADAVEALAARLPRPGWRRVGRALAAAAGLALVLWYGRAELRAGVRAFDRYRGAGRDLVQTAVHPVYGFIDRELPPDARLLFLNTNQGFFCPREYLADSFFEASQLADWLAPARSPAAARAQLAAAGVTHVLVANRYFGIAWPAPLVELLRDPDAVAPLYLSPDRRFTILALRPGPPAAPALR